MKMPKAVAVTILLMLAGAAQAAVITGQVWTVSSAVAQNAIPANVPGTTPDVVFDVNSPLDFSTGSSPSTTLATFLGSGGAFNIVENTPGTLASDSNDVLFRFAGFVTVTNGQLFSAGHDDGLTLLIGGLPVIDEPGPTGPVVTTRTYTGPSGNFPFELVYGECCGGPAVLSIDLPFSNVTAVPEPAPLALVGLGLLGLTLSRRRRG